jgi:hypothetical protein
LVCTAFVKGSVVGEIDMSVLHERTEALEKIGAGALNVLLYRERLATLRAAAEAP